jgi:hypothetical protein
LRLQLALGAPAGEISAYAGVNFLSEIGVPVYAFPGGNAALARAMAARVERSGAGRVAPGAAVFAVEPADGGYARVAWFDAQRPGEPRCIEARWAVVAAPYFLQAAFCAASIRRTAQMTRLRRAAIVANCCFEGPPAELPMTAGPCAELQRRDQRDRSSPPPSGPRITAS